MTLKLYFVYLIIDDLLCQLLYDALTCMQLRLKCKIFAFQ